MKISKTLLLSFLTLLTITSCSDGGSDLSTDSDGYQVEVDSDFKKKDDTKPDEESKPDTLNDYDTAKMPDVNDNKPDNNVPDIDNTPPVDDEVPDNTDQDSIVIDIDNTPRPDSDLEDIVSIDGVDMNLKNEDTSSVSWNGKISKVTITGDLSRIYTITTNEYLRCQRIYSSSDDGDCDTEKGDVGFSMSGDEKTLEITEGSGTQTNMNLRSGNDMLDALFAMSLKEVNQASKHNVKVKGIPTDCKDYNGNNSECFMTGAKWGEVYTRDVSYAIDLSLAAIAPTYSTSSLLVKTSEKNSGGGREIIQDTGTGGSWPVSTDRVVWALAANETVKYLDGAERAAFVNDAYEIAKNTIETDRKYVFDPTDGLYRGEQSFLDWREQTYPISTLTDVTPIASSKALSTNAVHYAILDFAASIAKEKGDASLKGKYRGWANDLKKAINDKMWIEQDGLYATMILNEFDPTPLRKYDMLGEALAIVLGIADQTKAEKIIRNYPNTTAGVPVIWPQHNEVFVYHNRAIWPFVTAYGLKAAKIAKNDAFVNLNVASLINGAALNLSNMENFEFTTLRNGYKDETSPAYYAKMNIAGSTGPAINSERQLWSVAAFTSMIIDTVFGLESNSDGIRFQPFITRKMRNEMLGNSATIKLNKFPYKGKEINIELYLPPVDDSKEGFYTAHSVKLNGVEKEDSYITPADLSNGDTIKIYVLKREKTGSNIKVLSGGNASNDPKYFAPNTPGSVEIKLDSGKLQVSFSKNESINAYGSESKDINNASESAVYNIYKDGVLVKEGLKSTTWPDDDSTDHSSKTHCYAVEAMYPLSKNRSHHAYNCYWGATSTEENRPLNRIWEVDNGGATSVNKTYTAKHSGKHLIQLSYINNSGGWEGGHTAGVKLLVIKESGSEVAKGPIVMAIPGISNSIKNNSTVLQVNFEAAKTYTITSEDGQNMSYFNYFNKTPADNNNSPEIHMLKVFFVGN